MAVLQVRTNSVAGGGSTSITIPLSSFSGTNVVIVVGFSAYESFDSYTISATWKGATMSVAAHATGALGGFGQGSAWVAYLAIGTVAGESGDVVVTVSGTADAGMVATASAVEGLSQSTPLHDTGTFVFVSSASNASLTVDSTIGDLLFACLCFSQTSAGPACTADSGQTKQGGLANSGGGFMSGVNGVGVAPAGASFQMDWSSFNSPFAYVLTTFNVASVTLPTITSVNGGSFAQPSDTNLDIIGTDLAPTGTTSLYYADGVNFGTAIKSVQNISSITSTTINWDNITLGAVGEGNNYLFVVTDEGGGSEQVSAAFPILVGASQVFVEHVVHTTTGATGAILVAPTTFDNAKAAIIRMTGNTATDTLQGNCVMSLCLVDLSGGKGLGFGANTSDDGQRKQIEGTSSVFILGGGFTNDVVRGTPSLGPDGLTIDFTINASGYKLEIIVIGGPDVESSVDTVVVSASPKTGIGFRPDILFGICSGQTAGEVSDLTFAILSLGVCKDVGSPEQWCSAANFNDTTRSSATKSGTFLAQPVGASYTWEMSITSIDADGYTWSGSNGDSCYVLALRMPGRQTFVGLFQKTDVSPGATQVLPDVGFDPGLFFFSTVARSTQLLSSPSGARLSAGVAVAARQDNNFVAVLPATGVRSAEMYYSASRVLSVGSSAGSISVEGEVTDLAQIGEMTWHVSSGGSTIWIGMAALEADFGVPPVITQVNGGLDVPTIDTDIPVVGTDFVPGDTELWYADSSIFASADKVLQNIDTVTATTLNWTNVNVGSVGAGSNWLFAVTDPGGANELVSPAFGFVTLGPASPVITSVDGGTVVDVTDTAIAVVGTTLFTVGTTSLYLADGTDFGTATLIGQNISAVLAASAVWDDVALGGLSLGPLWLFWVTDEGGFNEKISSAFAITVTEPSTPIITTIESEVPAADVFWVGLNIPIVGTEFDPGGVTELYLGDDAIFAAGTNVLQTISAVTATTINWDAVSQGTLNSGLNFAFVVTHAGDPQERVSPPFAVINYDVITPLITAVNGGSTVNEVDLNLTVSGQFLKRPGTEAFYLADGTNFGAAVKQLQTITVLDFSSFIWPSIVLGAVGTGVRWLFYVTDEGGANEQISSAFQLTIIPSTGITRIEQIGDGTGMVLTPVVDEDPQVDPDVNVLVFRDAANWTGEGAWYYARDFYQWPTADNDIILKGGLPGPWVDSHSNRVNTVATTDVDRILADENVDMFTNAARDVVVLGIWIHKLDLVNNDVDHASLWQLEIAGSGEYIELFVTTQDEELHLGIAYSHPDRHFMIHSESLLAATEALPGWVHVVAHWSPSVPHMRLSQGNNEETLSPAEGGPTAGLYEYSFILHDFGLVGGPNTPNIYYRFCAMWYGFGGLTTGEISTLGASLTQLQYELTLQSQLDNGTTKGPIHYYHCDDKIPDRYIHNHAKDLTPGIAVGGVIQRNLALPPWGVVKRLFSTCQIECPTSGQADFNDWGATMFAHIRFLGDTDDVGILFRLLHSATGASIELRKIAPGLNPTELNGKLQFIARDATGTPVVDFTWDNPSLDPFDGTFLAFGVTAGTGNDWKLSFGDIGIYTQINMGVDPNPAWHNQAYDVFEIGGMDMDVHSFGYHSEPDQDIHDLWYATWSTVLELLQFAETRDYDGFYWCQNDIVND